MDFEIALRAAYEDTDQMSFVYYSIYEYYIECARCETARNIGLTYKEIEDRGTLMPVIDAKLRYLKPIYHDDLATIKMYLSVCSEINNTFSLVLLLVNFVKNTRHSVAMPVFFALLTNKITSPIL